MQRFVDRRKKIDDMTREGLSAIYTELSFIE
jgi:hypothetical protein